jgi:hypothetical protein
MDDPVILEAGNDFSLVSEVDWLGALDLNKRLQYWAFCIEDKFDPRIGSDSGQFIAA